MWCMKPLLLQLNPFPPPPPPFKWMPLELESVDFKQLCVKMCRNVHWSVCVWMGPWVSVCLPEMSAMGRCLSVRAGFPIRKFHFSNIFWSPCRALVNQKPELANYSHFARLFKSQLLQVNVFVSLSSFLSSVLSSFRPSLHPSVLPSVLPSFLPSFLRSFVSWWVTYSYFRELGVGVLT